MSNNISTEGNCKTFLIGINWKKKLKNFMDMRVKIDYTIKLQKLET